MSEPDDPAALQQKINAVAAQYLDKEGWFNNKPVASDGCIPWFTYPAIAFLRDILSADARVLEYGSGYGTIFFNERAGECYSVEHDAEWARILHNTRSDMKMIVCGEDEAALPAAREQIDRFFDENFATPLSADRAHDIAHGLLNREFAKYASQIARWDKGYYDIVVVDGMARMLCGYLAAEFIADDGYIILDNSDRWQYNDLQRHLIDLGFGRIDFWGPGPVNTYPWCTSFFSKRLHITHHRIERPRPSGDLGW